MNRSRLALLVVSVFLLTSPLAASTYTVTNTNDSGAGSLRQAIIDANTTAGPNVVAFSIGTGPQAITPLTPLPQVGADGQPVTIDGSTQPGFAGKPLIEVRGSQIAATVLDLAGTGTTVKWLVVNHASNTAVKLAGGNTVANCYIGPDVTGTATTSTQAGIIAWSTNSQTNNILNNVISACGVGVVNYGWLVMKGNRVGVTADDQPLGNGQGMYNYAQYYGATIGGPNPGDGNIFGSNQAGLSLELSYTNPYSVLVEGNFIGITPSGASRPNQWGLDIYRAGNIRIAHNQIANNSYFGLYMSGAEALHNTVTQNSIWNNYYGYHLDDGSNRFDPNFKPITPNDPLDADSGPNTLLNFPIITSVDAVGGYSYVHGTYDSMPSSTFTLEFFSNAHCDASGNGQGQTYLTSTTVSTDAGGHATFALSLPVLLTAGQVVTATSTDAAGNTSEFSPCAAQATSGIFAFSVAVKQLSEASGSVPLTIVRTGGTAGSVTLNYATANGEAVAGSDFTAVNSTVTFADGETQKTVLIPLINDTYPEPQETFTVTLSNPTNGAGLGSPSTVTVWINDDDPLPSVSIADISVTEGNSGTTPAVFTMKLTGPSPWPATVGWSTSDGSALGAVDYQISSGTVTFAPGETQKTFTVNVLGDTQAEGDETFWVNINTPNGVGVARWSALCTIRNDDGVAMASIDDVTITEGDSGQKNVNFTISMTPAWPATSAEVAYVTKDGTARAGTDYAARSGSVIFNTGDTAKTISVPILGDTDPEGDETFTLQISLASSCCNGAIATFSKATGTATILNDDVGVGPSDMSMTPGQTVSYFVQMGSAKAVPLTVPLSNSAPDVVQAPASITIPAGAPSGSFDVKGLKLGTATITATLPDAIGGGTRTVVARVLRGGGVVVDPAEVSVAAGLSTNVRISVNPSVSEDVIVLLSAGNPAIASVPATVTIPAGGSATTAVHGLAKGLSTIFTTLPSSFANVSGSFAVFVTDAPTTPLLTSVLPSSGPTAGGTNVTIKGYNLTADCTIAFGAIAATSRNIVDATTITATTPPHVAGSVDVSLACGSNQYVLPAAFTYTDVVPSLTNVSPSFGATGGGTLVKLTGSNFRAGCWPFFDGIAARHTTLLSATSMTAATPPHALGSVDVGVLCGQASASLTNGYSYSTTDEPSPVVTGIDPPSAHPGERITIAGVRFRLDDTVTFGSTPAVVFSFAPDALVVRVPELPPGKTSINVADPAGHVSTTGPIFTVLDASMPQITTLNPSTAAPGTEVTVDGSGFRPGFLIEFGGVVAPWVSLDSNHCVIRVPSSVVPGSYPAEVWNAAGNRVSSGPTLTVVKDRITIAEITPRCTTTDGGIDVTIHGTSFAANATVTFGGIAATNVRVVDAQTIVATAPGNVAGLVRVVVANPGGDSASMSDAFRYISPFDPEGVCAAGSKRRAVR